MAKTSNGHSPLTLQQFQKILMPQIKNLIINKINEMKFKTGEDFDSLEEKIKHLPTKEEYFAREDETMGELKKLREEVAMTGQHYKDTNKRVDKIDKHLGINTMLQISSRN